MGILRRGEYVRRPRMNRMEFQPPPIVRKVQCEQSLRVRDIATQTDVSIDQDGHSWVHVTLLSGFAVQPVKRDRGAREILLFSPHYCYIRPGSGVGVKTDVALSMVRLCHVLMPNSGLRPSWKDLRLSHARWPM